MAKAPELKTCEHKAAADSIKWFVKMIVGRNGADRSEALAALSQMFNQMVAKDCNHCVQLASCSELDEARAVVTGAATTKSADGLSSAPPGAPGALMQRRIHRQRRLGSRPDR